MKPNPKKAFKRSTGAPRRGYRYTENTSGKIPNPSTEPIKQKKVKLKPMRSVSSGTTGYGQPTKTEKRKTRSL